MKRAIQINLAGTVFHIDEDAYAILRDYLTGVENQFSGSNDGPEVIQDMEHRMAELFSEKLDPHHKVISTEDVRDVLKTMGAPNDFGEKKYNRSENMNSERTGHRHYRRMYRNSVDKPVGGVCSGLGYYFNIDPLLIRLLFVIGLFVGFGFLVYIVLWIALPMAQTQEQIEEMRNGSNYY